MVLPETIYKGVTFSAVFDCGEYRTPDWTGELRLTAPGEDAISIAGTGTDGRHFFSVDADETALWPAGAWRWTLLATQGSVVRLAAQGAVKILALEDGSTPLQDAMKRLEAAEAELAERVGGKPYMLGWRDSQLTRMTAAELMTAVSYWRRKVAELQALADSACGKHGNRRITYGRFMR